MAQKNNLRSRDIEAIDDMMVAFDFCELYDVPTDGLVTVQELKDRLMLHYTSLKQGNVKTRIQDAMQRSGEEDEKKRMRLSQMFEELVQIIGTQDETRRSELVHDLLQKDNTSADLLGDCEERMDNLKDKDCVILVAGETSAGKSSFLNLLLGSEFLPTHTCSCTSSITTLRYGKEKQAKIIYGGPDARVDIIENLDKEGMEKLYNITYMKGKEREEGHNVKEVQVYLPIEFLKCGIVLADTPGIGENEFLETYLMEFITENEILGFIYIIFSDSPSGGLQEDRLLMLLKLVIDQQKKKKGALKFDPKAALFIANRFDAVEEESRDKVKSHILDRLGKFWPEFDESMAIFFSTMIARRDVDAHQDYINADYKLLLEGLSNLFSLAMDRRIRSSYKWIETVLKRINHYLKTTVTRLGMTVKENQENVLKQQTKLRRIREKSEIVVQELLVDIDEQSEKIVKDVKQYLSTPQARFLLCSVWKKNEIPAIGERITDANHWAWIKHRVDEAFYDRLCNAIEDWSDESSRVSTIEKYIVENMMSKLGILQEEISQMEHDLRSTHSSTGSNDSRRSKRFTVQLSLDSSAPIDVPLKLAPSLQRRVSKNPLTAMKAKKEADKFEKDATAWSKRRAEKLMEKLLHNKKKNKSEPGILTQLVANLMQRPRDVVAKLQQQIPRIVGANMALLDSLEDIIINDSRHSAKYEQMMVLIEGLKESLMNYGEGYIFVNDFKSNEIKVLQDTPTGKSLAQTFRFSELVTGRSNENTLQVVRVPQGLWSIVRPGSLHQDNKEIPISIKMYMPSSGVTHTFQEVAKLRCLLNKDVYLAEFLGIHHTEAVTPAYIFDGHLQPLQKFITNCTNPSSHFSRLFRQIAEGLLYIHSKGMVHMELTSSTITVTENGDVKLTGACVPRNATLPLEKDNAVDDFVYLAPEVLRSELYITPADVYGFGLLLYEVLTERKAFVSHRRNTFNDFVAAIDPEQMLGLSTDDVDVLTNKTLNGIKRCTRISENDRPNMGAVINILNDIKGNFKQEKSGGACGRRQSDIRTPGEIFRSSKDKEKNKH